MPEPMRITPRETLEVLEATADLLVLEARYAPRGERPPAHLHPAQDERFEILEGILRVRIGGEERDVRAGETLSVPRGTAHCMWNPRDEPVRARWETRPAGRTEQWFRALAALQRTRYVDASGRPRPLPFAALAHEFRDTFELAAGPRPVARAAVAVLALAARLLRQAPASTSAPAARVRG